jgi:BlaI family transcriptional regulator, penicillinase repressor
LINRLVKKGALGFSQEGRAYLYRPLVTESACTTSASEAFLTRVFGGSLQPMLAHFVGEKRLSAREIQELKRLLDGK